MRTMTLRDVADLANVTRPAVSMWRKRSQVGGVSMPFPEPVASVGGVERFDPADVVDYLRRTGRGNNADAQYDVAAISAPDGLDIEEVVTLLAWSVLSGEELSETSAGERARLAAEFDPEDVMIGREIRAMRPSGAALKYVDDLIEASFGPRDALERLESGRLKRETSARELTGEAVELMARVTVECAVYKGADGLVLRTDSAPIALEVADRAGLAVASGVRAVRRRAAICDIAVVPARIVDVVFVSAVGRSADDVLDTADETVLDLVAGQVAVLVGPAKVLTDTLSGPLQQRRSKVLRVGNVVAAVRLPRGMWREAHRQNLAMWVCLGGADEQRPCVIDLSAAPDCDLDDLVTDIAAALAQTDDRAFRYAARIDRAQVLAGGPLVPRGVRAPRLRAVDRTGAVDRVHAATLTTTSALEPVDVLVAPSPGRLKLRHLSLGELYDARRLKLCRGSRIRAEHAHPDGSVAVLPNEISGGIRMDPIDAERHYARSIRTEPGDVVFIERPNPQAWVDAAGGSMVACPARVLRLQPSAEFGPRLLTAIINDTAESGTEWRTWSVPAMSRSEADRLETVLAEVERYQVEAERRVAAAKDLKKALIDGVAAGALTLDATPTTPGIAVADK